MNGANAIIFPELDIAIYLLLDTDAADIFTYFGNQIDYPRR